MTNSPWVNPYTDNETALVIKLRESGWTGLRLTDKFREQFPDRSHKSVINKMQNLREKKNNKRKKKDVEIRVTYPNIFYIHCIVLSFLYSCIAFS